MEKGSHRNIRKFPQSLNEFQFATQTDIFKSLKNLPYFQYPNKSFKKSCYEVSSIIQGLLKEKLHMKEKSKVKPLSVKRLEKGMKKYFFGEFGVVTMKDKDLKKMYQMRRIANREKERNYNVKLATWLSQQKDLQCGINIRKSTSKLLGIGRQSPQDISHNKKTAYSFIAETNTNTGPFLTAFNPNKVLGNKMKNHNKVKNSHILKTKKYPNKKIHNQKNKSIQYKGRNNTSSNIFIKTNQISNHNASSVDNNNQSSSLIKTNNTNLNIISNRTVNNNNNNNNNIITTADMNANQPLFSTQYNSTQSTCLWQNFNKRIKSHRSSINNLKITLTDASNSLKPQLQKMNKTTYNYLPLKLKTKDQKEKEKDLSNVLDIIVDFDNKKEISAEMKRRINNKDNIKLRETVLKFSNEISILNPMSTMKLIGRIKDEYIDQTRTGKYDIMLARNYINKETRNKQRTRMYCKNLYLSKLFNDYEKDKRKLLS